MMDTSPLEVQPNFIIEIYKIMYRLLMRLDINENRIMIHNVPIIGKNVENISSTPNL